MDDKAQLYKSLKTFFGFENFKGSQELVIQNILNRRNTFVVMPTGGGKSICYQLPALMSEGTALVISPLIALMKNQVDQVRQFRGQNNVAHFINSSLSKKELNAAKEDLMRGHTKLLYLAPESLAKQENLDFLNLIKVSFVAVDEAHCISEWGHDFRPEYRKIRQLINSLDERIPLVALTATATPKVKEDILKILHMQDASIFESSFNRPNLYYAIKPKNNPLKDIVRYIKSKPGMDGIIYCLSRKTVEETAESLCINGINAMAYHAGLEPKLRTETQERFLRGDVSVIVATIAFGMGIDKPNVRYVIHYDMPKSMEGYYQETGRAGRDGEPAECIAYYTEKDVLKLLKFLKDKPIAEREIGTQILREVKQYAESAVCRRRQILHYFGEEFKEDDCGRMCDNCTEPKERINAGEQLLMLLKLVKTCHEEFSEQHYLNILFGSDEREIMANGHHLIPEYKVGINDKLLWESVMRQAVLDGYLCKSTNDYGVLRLTDKGEAFISNPEEVTMVLNEPIIVAAEGEGPAAGSTQHDEVLYGLLKEATRKLAAKHSLPAYVIFQDNVLKEMATFYPCTTAELSRINGVGTGKVNKYGKIITQLIADYMQQHDIQPSADVVVKNQPARSALKVTIIQNVDRKINLETIAHQKSIPFDNLLNEIESIVYSGVKLDISYYINQVIDDDRQDEVVDYLRSSTTDSLKDAMDYLGEDNYTVEELQLMRIKFISEYGN